MVVVVERSLVERVRARVRTRLEQHSSSLSDPRLADLVQVCINDEAPLLQHEQRDAVMRRVIADMRGLGALQQWLDDQTVTEVAVNRGTDVWIDRAGRMERVDHLEPGELHALIERAIAPLGLRFDLTSPVVDARLPNGHRMCAVLEPLAVDGTALSIRRFALAHVSLQSFAPPEVGRLIAQLVHDRCNIVVSGATSSGKTTLLNVLGGLIDPQERIITIEDTAELQLPSPHVVRMESRPATPEGIGAVSVGRLVRAALRLRPDRLVIGEVRGAEAFDMVHALNTGHDGSLATIHANSPADALRRIASLAELAAPGQSFESLIEQVHSSIDIVLQVARSASGERCVVEVAEVARPDAFARDGTRNTAHDVVPATRTLATRARVVAAPLRARTAVG